MVCDTSLWEIISTDLFGTITCTYLAASHFCFGIVTLLLNYAEKKLNYYQG